MKILMLLMKAGLAQIFRAAQIANLLYRRFVIGEAFAATESVDFMPRARFRFAGFKPAIQQITNLRYMLRGQTANRRYANDLGYARTPRYVLHPAFTLAIPVAALLFTGCGKQESRHARVVEPLATIAVRVQKVEPKKTTAEEEVVGTVRARVRATLESKLSARIEQLPVRLGQTIAAGQLIARLDAPEVKARLQQAQASLQQAEREWNRVKGLFDQQATTRSEYDIADSRYSVAKAAVAEAQAMADYVEVKAPFDGVVTRKWADVGDLAAPGKPLVDVENPSALQMEADVPEAIAQRIVPEARMAIRLDATGSKLSGVVREISPVVDPVSRTLHVKLDLPEGAPVRAGQFARLVVPVGETETIRVPAAAVVRRGQMEVAFVVAQNLAQLHLVKTGRQAGDEVEIVSGLEAGDPVVVEGAAQLADQQPVTLK